MRQITGYRIMDRKTGKQIGNIYTCSRRNVARKRADKLDNEYGAYRYVAEPIFESSAEIVK